MADLEPPSLGEVMRLLDGVTRRLDSILDKMDADRAEAARVYLRLDLYIAERKLLEAMDADLHRDIGTVDTKFTNEFAKAKADRDRDITWRRQASVMVGIAILGAFVSIGIAAFNALAR